MNFRIYTSEQEENICTRKNARTWQRSGLISEEQLCLMEAGTEPYVNQTNLFFRLIFFLFTLLCATAVTAFLIWLMNEPSDTVAMSILILFSIPFYLLAEYVIKKYSFYRYGIEEALALTSIVSLCIGCGMLLDKYHLDHQFEAIAVSLIFAVTSFWIYLRFGFLYSALISIIALCAIPFQLSLPPTEERAFLLLILCLILLINMLFDKSDIEDFRKERNSLIQACLLAAIYLAVNLRLPELVSLYFDDRSMILQPYAGFLPYIYWLSYILTFLIPTTGIYWGIKKRKRLILNVSLVIACLTLAINKSYLQIERYAWDPAILGIMLIFISTLITRWLSRGPNKTRYGFTAENILKPESHGISLADIGAALTPGFVDSQQPPSQSEKYFDGGKSGGGGASRDF
jgi:hypothetical protein